MSDQNVFVDPKEYLDIISNNLIEAEANFRLYCHLLKMKGTKRRFDVFKKYLSMFTYMQNALLYDCILKMTKIMDPVQQGRGGCQKNIVFGLLKEIFIDEANEMEKKTINHLTDYLDKNLEKIKTIRNKEIAHLDKFSRRVDVFRSANQKIRLVKKYIYIQMELLNVYKMLYYKRFFKPYFFNSFVINDIKNLFSDLFYAEKLNNKEIGEKNKIDKLISREIIKNNFKYYSKIENNIRMALG